MGTCRTQQEEDGDSLERMHSVTSGMLGTKILDLDPSRSESLWLHKTRVKCGKKRVLHTLRGITEKTYAQHVPPFGTYGDA